MLFRSPRTRTLIDIPRHCDEKINSSVRQRAPSVFYTNCRSLSDNKLDDLKLRLNNHKSDIICLTETWFDNVREMKTSIPGFKLYSANRSNRVGGGAAVFVNADMNVSVLERCSTRTWSSLWLLVKNPQMLTMIIGCIYHPPSDNANINLEKIESTLNKLTIEHPQAKMVLCGDFNHMELNDLAIQSQLTKAMQFATRVTAYLDQILTDISQYQPAVKLPPLIGNEQDHCCIHLPGQNIAKKRYKEVYVRQCKSDTRTRVLLDIATHDWTHITVSDNLDDMVDNYYSAIESILDLHCPLKRKKVRVDNSFVMTPLIEKLINARDREYRNHCKSISWKFFSCLVRRLISKAKRSYAATKLNKAVASKAWWKEINKIDGKCQDNIPECHLMDGQWLTTSEVTDELNRFFSQIGGNRQGTQQLCKNLPGALSPVSIGEVKYLLKQLNTHKATHSNDIPTWVSKAGAEDLCIPVTSIINKMLETQEYPRKWKNAQIRPLKKISNAACAGDYRPISLLHHLGKLAEDVILRKLKSTVESKLGKNQFAYRKQHCTTDALLKLINNWCASLDDLSTSHISAAMIDMSKAFDRLHPDVLKGKLQQLGVSDALINLIDSFLTNRLCSVRIDQHEFTLCEITMGAPQGTKLGPWLWLIYIDEPECETIKYADDITIYSIVKKNPTEHHKELQPSLNYISQWASDNNMLINTRKTHLVKMTLSEPKHTDNYVIYDVSINISSHTKLLGVTIDSRLSFAEHVNDIVSRTSFKLFTMRRLRRLGANEKCLMMFYRSHILSVITYAAPAWSSLITDGSVAKLDQIQRRALRIIHPDGDYETNLQTMAVPNIKLHLDDRSEERRVGKECRSRWSPYH